jgi:hypothetical protein
MTTTYTHTHTLEFRNNCDAFLVVEYILKACEAIYLLCVQLDLDVSAQKATLSDADRGAYVNAW